jgi:hypothetical protein
MAEQTHNRDMTDQSDRQDLEDRVEQLESTISKMLPSRRDALKLGGAALVGGAAMSGTASAGSESKGTIGTSGALVDVESEDINNADTITTENLIVNQSATGPFGGGVVLESGDSVTVKTIGRSTSDDSLVTLFDGSAKDVLGGTVTGGSATTFEYTFADNTVLNKDTGQSGYTQVFTSRTEIEGGSVFEVDFLPPAKDVTKIEVGHNRGGQNNEMGAEVLLKD